MHSDGETAMLSRSSPMASGRGPKAWAAAWTAPRCGCVGIPVDINDDMTAAPLGADNRTVAVLANLGRFRARRTADCVVERSDHFAFNTGNAAFLATTFYDSQKVFSKSFCRLQNKA